MSLRCNILSTFCVGDADAKRVDLYSTEGHVEHTYTIKVAAIERHVDPIATHNIGRIAHTLLATVHHARTRRAALNETTTPV